MKIKIFKVLMLIVLVLSVLLKIFLKEFHNIFWIMIDVFIILYFIGEKMQNKFINQRIVDFLTDTKRKEYDKLLICDERYSNKVETDCNTFKVTNYNRNFYTDYLILQRYYSFLKRNGEVIFIFDYENSKYFESKKIDSMDYLLLHIVTLIENNINLNAFERLIIHIINSYKILAYKIGIYKLLCFKNKNTNNVICHNDKIEELYKFANDRNLKLKIIFRKAPNLEDLKQKYSGIKFEEMI